MCHQVSTALDDKCDTGPLFVGQLLIAGVLLCEEVRM